jgi:hypothetical protein
MNFFDIHFRWHEVLSRVTMKQSEKNEDFFFTLLLFLFVVGKYAIL